MYQYWLFSHNKTSIKNINTILAKKLGYIQPMEKLGYNIPNIRFLCYYKEYFIGHLYGQKIDISNSNNIKKMYTYVKNMNHLLRKIDKNLCIVKAHISCSMIKY
jgi:hypothetical protein